MNRLRKYADEAGIVGVTIFATLAVVLAFTVYFGGPEVHDQVTSNPPYIEPAEPDLAVGEGMIPPGLGAAPNTTYPRFTSTSTKTEFKLADAFSLRGTHEPQAVVIHVGGIEGTRSDACDGLVNYLRSNEKRVSAHFIVCNEKIVQSVEIANASHHAGIWGTPTLSNPLILTWWQRHLVNPAEGNPNLETIGIETPLTWGNIVTTDPTSRWAKLRLNLIELLVWINKNVGIPLDRTHVMGHFELDGTNRGGDPVCCLDIDEIVATAADIANGPDGIGAIPIPTPEPETFPQWDGGRFIFEGGREGGWSWAVDPAPWGIWFYKNVPIWDACDPTWNGRRSPLGFWVNVGQWVFFEQVNTWIEAPPC